jgi:hypothetical protein
MMAKKRSGSRKSVARKKKGGGAASRVLTAQDVLDLWKSTAKVGLGGKVFDPAAFTTYEPLLLNSINKQLLKGAFDAHAKKATTTVARDLGRICAMLTNKHVVSIDIFDQAFALVRDQHWACPLGTGGGGSWCDI